MASRWCDWCGTYIGNSRIEAKKHKRPDDCLRILDEAISIMKIDLADVRKKRRLVVQRARVRP